MLNIRIFFDMLNMLINYSDMFAKKLANDYTSRRLRISLQLSPLAVRKFYFFLKSSNIEFVIILYRQKYYLTLREMSTPIRFYLLYPFSEIQVPTTRELQLLFVFRLYVLGLVSETYYNNMRDYISSYENGFSDYNLSLINNL